jgi:hypothetical protein
VNVQKAVQKGARSTDPTIEQQLVAAVDRSTLRKHPFDHIVMKDVLDPESYRALLAAMPDRQFYHELRHQDALRPDGSSTRLRLYLFPELLRRLPTEQRRMWTTMAAALSSAPLEVAFKHKFRSALEERFGKPVERLGLFPVPILLRDQPGYRIGIHSDKFTKGITVQLYLPGDDSQRHVGTIFHEGQSGAAAEKTTQMPFLPASGYAFPVSLTKSWHSAAPTTDRDGERVSMMVTYYVADNLFQRLYWQARRVLLSLGVRPER